MFRKTKGIKKFLRFFMLLLIATFSSFIILNDGFSNMYPTEAVPGKDKDIEDPDDEDYGGIGAYSFGKGESETENESKKGGEAAENSKH